MWGDGIRPIVATLTIAVRRNIVAACSGDKPIDILTPWDSNSWTLNMKSEIGEVWCLVGGRSGGWESNSSGIGLEGNEKMNCNEWLNKCPH